MIIAQAARASHWGAARKSRIDTFRPGADATATYSARFQMAPEFALC